LTTKEEKSLSLPLPLCPIQQFPEFNPPPVIPGLTSISERKIKTSFHNNPVLLNVRELIRDNLKSDPNSTEESVFHLRKHSSPQLSTDTGIMISIKSV
jgi:hypothetical protein